MAILTKKSLQNLDEVASCGHYELRVSVYEKTRSDIQERYITEFRNHARKCCEFPKLLRSAMPNEPTGVLKLRIQCSRCGEAWNE